MAQLTIEQALQQGIEAHKAGRIQEADRLYTAILKAQPKHPDANHNMGVLAVSVGKVEQALPFFETALEANPAIAHFWLSYIDTLIKLGKLTDAKAAFDQAKSKGAEGDGFIKLGQRITAISEKRFIAGGTTTATHQDGPETLQSLKLNKPVQLENEKPQKIYTKGAIYPSNDIHSTFSKYKKAKLQNKSSPTQAALQQATRQDPPQNELDEIMQSVADGNLKDSIVRLKHLFKKFPNSSSLFISAGNINKELGKPDAAIFLYERALAIKPESLDALNNLGATLREQNKLNRASRVYYKALKLHPKNGLLYYNLGIVFKDGKKIAKAIRAFQLALLYLPILSEAHVELGNSYISIGKTKKAIEAYNSALAIRADCGKTHRYLSKLKKYQQNDPQISMVDNLLKHRNLSSSNRCNLLYTRAKMSEDLLEFKEAFEFYKAAGSIRKKILGYEFSADEALFKLIKDSSCLFKNVSPKVDVSSARITPTFIIGMPRSGTTLIEQIIASHPHVHACGELPFISDYGFKIITGTEKCTPESIQKFRDFYLSKVTKDRSCQVLITDKTPHNFLYIPLILSCFPSAKIVHVQRSPAATCWSNFKHYFASVGLGYSYDLNDTVKYFLLYRSLMRFWKKQYGPKIYHVNYDDLTQNQNVEIRQLINYLNLNWHEACLSPHLNSRTADTASQQQVKKKIYKDSSSAWLQYRPFIGDLFSALEHF